MQLIDADKARHGLTITAQTQTRGKGQRGKTWADEPGSSLLMSVIADPGRPLTDQFCFNASVAVAIVTVLQKLYGSWDVRIKWPNDIIVNDKKAGGILIENVIRGSHWAHTVIGLGLNVKQRKFPDHLPYATSLTVASGLDFEVPALRDAIIGSILSTIEMPRNAEMVMDMYNQHLFKLGAKQSFGDGTKDWEATILAVHADGALEVRLEDGARVFYHHGQVLWIWA